KAAFLDPLPYRDAARLVTVVGHDNWHPNVSEFFEIHDRSRTLDQVAFVEHQDMQLSGTDEPERVYAARVSASFFSLLGASTSLGRTFRPEENQPGHAPTMVLTDGFWRAKMAADPRVVGRTLRLDG